MRSPQPIVSGLYVSEADRAVNRRLQNMYPVYITSEAATQSALVSTPGIEEIADVTVGISRGVIILDAVEYRVIGNTFYQVDKDGTTTNKGTVSGGKDVSMATNGINISILDPEGNNYFYTPSTGIFEQNVNTVFQGFGQATSVVHKDGYYVYTTNLIFFASSFKGVNDGKDFNALDFDDAEISEDQIIKAWVNHNQLYIMGENIIEIYQTIATEGFPFQRVPNGLVQKGCIAPNSVSDFDGGFLFIGGDVGELPSVWRGVGSSFSKISDASIDQLIHQIPFADIQNASCWTYAQNGAYFAVFRIGDNTFVYDSSASKLKGSHQWHARQSGIGDGDVFYPWRALHGAYVYGELRVGDDQGGKIGKLVKGLFTEYGDKIERVIPTIPFNDNLDPIFAGEIELFMKTGVGNAAAENPQIRMDYSDNGGASFGSERKRSMGKVGQRELRVRWTRLGRIPMTRMFRFKVTDPVDVEVNGLYADSEGS